MIEANEIRIGNLLLWNTKLVHPKTTLPPTQVEVASVFNDRIGYISPGVERRAEPFEDDLLAADAALISLEELEPVPVTPELLANCGFKRRGEDWSKDNFLYQSLSAPDQQWSFAGQNLMPAPAFLHQLQNVYFDKTGNVLEISL